MNMDPDLYDTACAVSRTRFVVWASKEQHHNFFIEDKVMLSVPPF